MLEQVWKNVVGAMFPYTSADDKVIVTISRGSTKRIYDFGQLIGKVQDGLGAPVNMQARLDEEGLLQITIEEAVVEEKQSLPPVESEVEELVDVSVPVELDTEPQVETEVSSAPAAPKRGRRKKEN